MKPHSPIRSRLAGFLAAMGGACAPAVFFLLVASAAADVMYYEGRLRVDGVPFQGEGRFTFSSRAQSGALGTHLPQAAATQLRPPLGSQGPTLRTRRSSEEGRGKENEEIFAPR